MVVVLSVVRVICECACILCVKRRCGGCGRCKYESVGGVEGVEGVQVAENMERCVRKDVCGGM